MEKVNVGLIGAGEAGATILREILRMPVERYRVVGFLDDDPARQKGRIHDIPVLGMLSDDRLAVVVLRYLAPDATRSGDGDTPLRVLLEGLAQAAMLSGNRESIAAEIQAANGGVVLLARYLGIYGNTVVIDHGYGLMSLYGHMSSIAVEEGQRVERGEPIGRTGATGLAGGDHLHFAIMLRGLPVNPREWWDGHWIHDRLKLKLGASLPFKE